MEKAAEAPLETSADVEQFSIPMYDRVILAFLARSTNRRNGDGELLGHLEHPQSKMVGDTILKPDQTPSSVGVARIAQRFFLDAGNLEDAERVRHQIMKLEGERVHRPRKQIVDHLHAVQLA